MKKCILSKQNHRHNYYTKYHIDDAEPSASRFNFLEKEGKAVSK